MLLLVKNSACFCNLNHFFVAFKENDNLKGKNVLEVGSGRGGGLNYISTSLKPQKCIGVDLSLNQVEFCRRAYASNPNIEFFEGDSERLAENPVLRDKQFDLIVNVESSHCYGNFRVTTIKFGKLSE